MRCGGRGRGRSGPAKVVSRPGPGPGFGRGCIRVVDGRLDVELLDEVEDVLGGRRRSGAVLSPSGASVPPCVSVETEAVRRRPRGARLCVEQGADERGEREDAGRGGRRREKRDERQLGEGRDAAAGLLPGRSVHAVPESARCVVPASARAACSVRAGALTRLATELNRVSDDEEIAVDRRSVGQRARQRPQRSVAGPAATPAGVECSSIALLPSQGSP